MSIFLPEQSGAMQPGSGVASITPASPETTQDDIALMQRVLSAAMRNPNLIPSDFMAYLFDYIQTQRLAVPIGQVFGWQRVSTQVITDFAQIPTPVDGQIVFLKLGSSAPFTYIQMLYDQAAAQWVSEEFSIGGANVVTQATSPAPGGFAGAISWSPVHVGGLTMQVKWAGEAATASGNAGHGGVYLLFANFTGGSPAVTTATYSDQSTTSLSFVNLGADWTSVTDPGDYRLCVGTIYGYTANATDTVTVKAGVVARFIK